MKSATTSPGRVILTHARSLHAMAAAMNLGRHGVEVIGCDHTPMMAASFSKYVSDTFLLPAPEDGEAAWLDALEEEVARRRPDDGRPYVLMPVHARTRLVAEHRERYERHARVAAPPIEAIRRVEPKSALADTCEELGVRAPLTRRVPDREALARAAEEIRFPAFLKLPDATASVGLSRVESQAELEAAYAELERNFDLAAHPPLMQEAVPGDDYCLTVLYDHGTCRAHMAYRNLHTLPRESGFGIVRESVPSEGLLAVADRLLAAIGWNGVAEIDFRWSGREEDAPWLIEVNARFWGGLFQSVESGVDYPWLLYRLTVDGTVAPAPPAKVGVRTRVPLSGLTAAVNELAADDGNWERLSRHWELSQRAWERGDAGRALRLAAGAVTSALDPRQRLERVQQALDDSRAAKAELLSTDDPWSALGALYVLGSLVRNGRLPEEIRREG